MKRLIFFIPLFLFMLVGCERERNYERNYERTIWINPDVECCGVKDPLTNLEWLKEWYEFSLSIEENELSYPIYGFIYIFKNYCTSENFIVTRVYQAYHGSWFKLSTCDGEIIDEGIYWNYNFDFAHDVNFSKQKLAAEPCDSCDSFFEKHILADTIAYFYTETLYEEI